MAHILIIEDEQTIRTVIRRALVLAGYEVTEAFDGEDGMELFRESPADLVVTDLQMPRKDGLQVIRELRADFPDVKIIAITGFAPKHLLSAEELGANRTYTKPLDLRDLVESIRELLDEGS